MITSPFPAAAQIAQAYDRLFYGFACSLFGAGIAMAIVFWTDIGNSAKVFGAIMGISFLGGCLFGSRFLNIVGDLLKRIW